MIYLDNAATTPIHPEVFAAMEPWLKDEFGNPGGRYALGRRAAAAVEEARRQVASMINTEPDFVVFTSGATESNNAVMNNALRSGVKEIFVSAVEHDSVLNSVPDSISVTKHVIPVDRSGVVSAREIASLPGFHPREEIVSFGDDGLLLRPTTLVSVMYVNNETGAVNPVEEIGELSCTSPFLFHTDCTQAAGLLPIDVKKIGCDYLTLSSHKIHGPKGVGALYAADSFYFRPLIHGGRSQEFGIRGGTENVAGIVGFGKACELASQHLRQNAHHVSLLKQSFFDVFSSKMNELGYRSKIHVNGPPVIEPGRILSIRIDGLDAATLVLAMDVHNVAISAGSACTSLEDTPSHVLTAMGLEPEEARSTVRISFSSMNSEDEVRVAASAMAGAAAGLMNIGAAK